jgi:hypothetical protein
MFCWYGIWSAIQHYFGFAIACLLLTLAGLAIWAPRLQPRWLRYTVRAIGICVAIPASLLVLLGAFVVFGATPAQYKIVSSPADTYQARQEYDAGFLGRDFSEVTIKKHGCCWRYRAFALRNPSSLGNIHLKWLDDHHLQISYIYFGPGYGSATCRSSVDGVKVTCIALPPNTNGAAEAAP